MATVSLSSNSAGAPAPAGGAGRPDWVAALRTSLKTVADLVAHGLVPAAEAAALTAKYGHLRLGIPRAYAARFRRSNLTACPLWRQAVPWAAEDDPALPGWAAALSQEIFERPVPWQADAIGDVAHLAAPRLTHRYVNRALLHTTAACALYCRFCFRKAHLASREASLYAGGFGPAWAYLAQHPEIRELVLSGGDPLLLQDTVWQRILAEVRALGHIRTLRVHSRVPATLPERLTPALLALWRRAGVTVVLVAHFNHPRELTQQTAAALRRARRAGAVLLNQAVLLRGINDRVATLVALHERLYGLGVLPYYLHHPDYTPNTWGFRLGIGRGRALVRLAHQKLSGPARPRYVLDLPQGGGKVDLLAHARRQGAAHVDAQAGLVAQVWRLKSPQTRRHCPPVTRYLDLFPRDRSATNARPSQKP